VEDISERKKAQEELLRAKDKAEESDRLKSAFLANMSHEIRTHMNGILGFAELLKEPHLTDGEQQQYISIIEKSGKRMLNIIGDIVSISKIESGQMEISSPKQISMNKSNTFIPSSILKLKKKDCSC
jgi:signal transduction histidine kinase